MGREKERKGGRRKRKGSKGEGEERWSLRRPDANNKETRAVRRSAADRRDGTGGHGMDNK